MRLAWEGMSLMWPSMRSHCKACFCMCFASNSEFLSDTRAGGVLYVSTCLGWDWKGKSRPITFLFSDFVVRKGEDS